VILERPPAVGRRFLRVPSRREPGGFVPDDFRLSVIPAYAGIQPCTSLDAGVRQHDAPGRSPCLGRRNGCRSGEPVLGEVIAQRALADAHPFRGVLLDAERGVQRQADRFAFDPFDVLTELERWHA